MTSSRTIGVSLKMYFEHHRTVQWCTDVAERIGTHPAVRDGSVRVFIIPGFLDIPEAVRIFADTPLIVGAQDVATEDFGAYTGEVSAAQLQEVGVGVAEVGHAERRRLFGEDDEMVQKKTAAALRNGLTPVLCVGEHEHTDPERAAEITRQQLAKNIAGAPEGEIIVAYEPVWAIGAPEPANPAHITTVTGVLKSFMNTVRPGSTVIYGGSAGSGLLAEIGDHADGLFLGRFAHDVKTFSAVIDEAAQLPAISEVTS